jgi:branched-subunit amino acid transport protein
MAAVTFLTRLPLWLLATRRTAGRHRLDPFLEQIPIAAFAAIVFTGVLQPEGRTTLEASNLYLYAAAVTVATGIAARGRLLPTLLTGTAAAMALDLLFG